MACVITRLNNPNDVVAAHFAPLFDPQTKGTADYLLIGRRASIDIHQLDRQSSTLILRKRIKIFEVMLDMKPFKPLDMSGTWFVVATESGALVLLGFRGIEDVVIQRMPLGQDQRCSLSVMPSTLCVDSSKFISTLTNEGSVCFFLLHRAKDLKNFQRALDGVKRQKLFKDLTSFTISNQQGRTPLTVECIAPHYEESSAVITLSVIHRDELYNHYHSYYIFETPFNFYQDSPIMFNEQISPIVLPIGLNMGSIFFGKNALYVRGYCRMVRDGVKCSQMDELSLISSNGVPMVKKSLRGPMKITAAMSLTTNDFKLAKLLLLADDGSLYLSVIQFEVNYDSFGAPQTFYISSWSMSRFESKLFRAEKIVKLSDSHFLIHSLQRGMCVFNVDFEHLRLEVTDLSKSMPPILDINVTGTITPKVQICGGSSMHEGVISTQFKGYESQVVNKLELKIPTPGSSGIWCIDETYIVKHIEGVLLYQSRDGDIIPKEDHFHGIHAVNGEIHDVFLTSAHKLMMISDKGVYAEDECINSLDIIIGCFSTNGVPVFVTQSSLYYKDQVYKVKGSQVSSISCTEFNRAHNILLGHWDGHVALCSNGSMTTLTSQRTTSISCVRSKVFDKQLCHFIGTSHGQLFYHREGKKLVKWNLGSSPVSVMDCRDCVIVWNSENVVKLVFDSHGECIHKGFISMEAPECLNYCDGKVISLSGGAIVELSTSQKVSTISHELQLNRLVKKCISFKNCLHLSLFLTMTELYSTTYSKPLIQCQLEVIENNTFTRKSLYKFPLGVECTDVVNLTYKADAISGMEEPPINIGVESYLSQCFAVSCVHHVQDIKGPPIQVFSIDQAGKIKHVADTPVSTMKFYSLASHVNRLLIAGGEKLCAFQIEYSLEHATFKIQRVSDWLSIGYVNQVSRVGVDVLISQVLGRLKRYKLQVKSKIENDVSLKWREVEMEMSVGKFPVSFDIFQDLLLSVESSRVLSKRSLSSGDGCDMSLPDQINVIKSIDFFEDGLTISELRNTAPPSIPMFVMGSVSGGVYLVTLLRDSVFSCVDLDLDLKGWQFDLFRGGQGDMSEEMYDGDFVQDCVNQELSRAIAKSCKLI